MVHFCAVYGCGNKSVNTSISFFRLPAVNLRCNEGLQSLQQKRRNAWLTSIQRKDLTTEKLKYARVCSVHFLSGKPAELYDETNPDWLPSRQMGYKTKSNGQTMDRFERAKNRNKPDHATQQSAQDDNLSIATPNYICEEAIVTPDNVCEASCQVNVSVESTGTQTTLTSSNICSLENDLINVNQKKYELSEKVSAYEFSEGSFRCNKSKVTFYTGLPNFNALMVVLYEIAPFLTFTTTSALNKFQQLVLTLMKLRLNLQFKDLAFRFNISNSTASRIFHHVVSVLYQRLDMVVWPEREELWETMPLCFQKAFGKSVTVIIDCFEVFIERPSNLMARSQTWSAYKHHNTVKFLIGICPQGTVTFISEGWGGRVSDKWITENCGILKKLLPGDTVLADRGFNICDEVAMYHANVKIPAYTKGKNQLHPLEIEATRTIASVRIHVERVIGTIRQKYQILNGPLPIEMLVNDGDGSTIDKIVRVCSSLHNMCRSVVSLE